MTGTEWVEVVERELAAAGFELIDIGVKLPTVASPDGLESKVRLLKLRLSVPASRRIYTEGVVFYPPELERAVEETA